MGDVFDPDSGEQIAGLLTDDHCNLRNSEALMYKMYEEQAGGQGMSDGAIGWSSHGNDDGGNGSDDGKSHLPAGNTTIGVILTNADFNKTDLTRIADMTHNGLARTIRPVHTMADGDTVYAMASGTVKTNVDLAGEARTADFLRSADEMDPSDLATYSFGQNFNVTMIQLATGFCSLINGGYYYEPHMVSKITNSSGVTVKSIEPRVLKRTISDSTSEFIRECCQAVVTEGTGKAARPAGYMIGGKTGTAQTYPRDGNEFVVSFIGYAPADDPQILVYVVVDRVNEPKQDNVGYAREIVRNIFTEVLPYKNIFMTEELSDKEIKELEALKLENTLKYGKALENPNAEVIQEDKPVEKEPEWKKFPIDQKTGYRKDPNTGELTGALKDYLD